MAVITFAHRGGRADLPENTLPAFRRALELGARGLETDARLSADGEVVLAHDERIRRGLRRIRVPDTDCRGRSAELDVPRLADLYDECGVDFELSVDLKQREVARPLIEAARAAGGGAPGRLWVCSGSLKLLAELRDEAPDVKLVYSPGRNRVAPPAMERHAADLAAAGRRLPEPAPLRVDARAWSRCSTASGSSTFAWDTQETRYILAALRQGMDGIFCDRVDRMVATVGEWTDATPSSTSARVADELRQLQEAEVAGWPDAHEDATDQLISLDRAEERRVLRVLAVVAQHEVRVGRHLLGPERARLHVVREVRLAERATVDEDLAVPALDRLAGQADEPLHQVLDLGGARARPGP